MEKTQYNFCWVNQIKLMSCLEKVKIVFMRIPFQGY